MTIYWRCEKCGANGGYDSVDSSGIDIAAEEDHARKSPDCQFDATAISFWGRDMSMPAQLFWGAAMVAGLIMLWVAMLG